MMVSNADDRYSATKSEAHCQVLDRCSLMRGRLALVKKEIL